MSAEKEGLVDRQQRENLGRLLEHSAECRDEHCGHYGCDVMKKIIIREAQLIITQLTPSILDFLKVREVQKKICTPIHMTCRDQSMRASLLSQIVNLAPDTVEDFYPSEHREDRRFMLRYRLRLGGYCHAVIERIGDDINVFLVFTATPITEF